MKIYIPSAVTETDFKYPMEMFAAIPYCNDILYSVIADNCGWWNDGVFSKLFFMNSPHERVNTLEECKHVVIPFKYQKDDPRISKICAEAYNHLVFAFFCDDSAEEFETPRNMILFRTSLFKSRKIAYERSMPVLVPDHKPGSLKLTDTVVNKTITYCGHLMHNRDKQLHHLKTIYNNHYIISRSGFWSPELPKDIARREYYNNLAAGDITFCSRGNGNFSYRFYEALSFGRIPLLIDTDCELPFERRGAINWDDYIIRISEEEFFKMKSSDFSSYINDKCIGLSPIRNRKLWETMLSPEGYFTNFYKDV
jgi:hypothetical protein